MSDKRTGNPGCRRATLLRVSLVLALASAGCTASPASAAAPNGQFTAAPNPTTTSVAVNFDAQVGEAISLTNPETYAWDFGDGITATGKTTAHTYRTPGIYTARLTVRDPHYPYVSTSQTIYVTEQGVGDCPRGTTGQRGTCAQVPDPDPGWCPTGETGLGVSGQLTVLGLQINGTGPFGLTCASAAPVDPTAAGHDDGLTPVRQPDASRSPTFNTTFGTTLAARNDDTARVAVAVGADRVLMLNQKTNAFWVYNASTLAVLTQAYSRSPTDVAFYGGEFFVADSFGDVTVHTPDGFPVRTLHGLHAHSELLPSDLRDQGIRYVGIDVAWGEIWATFQVEGRRSGGVVVLDARTGAIKSVLYAPGRTGCPVGSYNPMTGTNTCALGGTASTVGLFDSIGAVPELSSLITNCRSIDRRQVASLTLGAPNVETSELTSPTPCRGTGDAIEPWLGNDTVPGMSWFLQTRGSYAKHIDEYAVVRPVNGSATLQHRRTWQPNDPSATNPMDVAYRPRGTKVDWSGPLTKDPSDWLRSPSSTADKCLHYVVSDADIFVASYRGERWYELAQGLTRVDLLVDGVVVNSSTLPESDFCINTRSFTNGPHAIEVKAWLDGGARSVSSRNDHLRIDNAAPTGFLVGPETLATGTTPFTGQMDDPHSGPKSMEMQILRAGQSQWEALCTAQPVDGSPGRYRCDWPTSNGQYPDGTYQLRALITDNAGEGGNSAATAAETVEVDNTEADDGVTSPEDLSATYEEVAQPDTANEASAPDDVEFTDPEAAADHNGSYQATCGDGWGVSIAPSYGVPELATPPLNLTPEAALVRFMANGGMPAVPPSAFVQEVKGSDYAIYAARLDGTLRAFVVVEQDLSLGWIGTYYEGCSDLPAQLSATSGP